MVSTDTSAPSGAASATTTDTGAGAVTKKLPDRVLVQARACPRCEAPAMPSSTMQICVHCKKPFFLAAGPRLEPSLVPKSTGAKAVKVNYGDAVMRYSAAVDDAGITVSELDPVTGRIAVGKRTIAWGDVVSIGLYRRIDWVFLVALVLLFFVPIVLPLLFASFASSPFVFVASLPALALFALGLKKSVGVGLQRMRITPADGPPMLFRFDTPMWKRKRFLTGVLVRSGVGDVPWT